MSANVLQTARVHWRVPVLNDEESHFPEEHRVVVKLLRIFLEIEANLKTFPFSLLCGLFLSIEYFSTN